jgi:hypothetical protein
VRTLLREHDIPLIAVQYPLRTIEPLEELLDRDPAVVFVDNERLFRDAVTDKPWNAYFTDAFAGDFGHLNRAGNRLLAENVARAVERVLDAPGRRSSRPRSPVMRRSLGS